MGFKLVHGEENIGIFGAYRQLNTNLYGSEGELERESRLSDSCMSCWGMETPSTSSL